MPNRKHEDEYRRLITRAEELRAPVYGRVVGECVACGESFPTLIVKDSRLSNHHCDPRREAKIEGGRRAHSEDVCERTPSPGKRLRDGFTHWQADGDDELNDNYFRQ